MCLENEDEQEGKQVSLIKEAMPEISLDRSQKRALADILYTLAEKGEINDISDEDALLVWAAVEIARKDLYTEDMAL